ncbi:MAG: hypothetical protein ACLUGP_03995 [Faecalibacterium prausnitzii]
MLPRSEASTTEAQYGLMIAWRGDQAVGMTIATDTEVTEMLTEVFGATA